VAKILRNSARRAKGQETKKSSGSKSAARPHKGLFFSIWVFGVIVWVGLLLWAYHWSSKKTELHQKVVKSNLENADSKNNQPTAPSNTPSNHSPQPFPRYGEEKSVEMTQSLPLHSENGGEDQVKAASSDLDKHSSQKLPSSREVVPEPSSRDVPVSSPVSKHYRRISIIIDDMGGSMDIAKKFLELPYPIALAVLPYEPYSREVARLAKEHGKVVLLHMPMEPHGYPEKNPGKGALLLGQDRDTQRKLFLKALEQVPGAVGVNNHMGSRFTENRESMRVFLELVKEKNLFFIDSATTDKTVACDVAREVGVPCLRRDVFLDHEVTASFARAQLVRLFDIAQTKDLTIAIGHPHKITLELLQKGFTETSNKNIKVVSLDFGK